MKMETLVGGSLLLGESLSGKLLGILEQIEDINEHMLSKMGGKILGYNTSHKPYYPGFHLEVTLISMFLPISPTIQVPSH